MTYSRYQAPTHGGLDLRDLVPRARSPTRLRLVAVLAKRREGMTVGAIMGELRVAQSTVSQHLKILTEVRFILAEDVGTSSLYCVNERCVECLPTAAWSREMSGSPAPEASRVIARRTEGAISVVEHHDQRRQVREEKAGDDR